MKGPNLNLKKKSIRLITLSLLPIFFISCGPDDSSAETEDEDKTYDLTNIWTKNDYSFNSTGISSSNSNSYTYTLKTTKQNDTIIDGVLTTTLLSLGSLINNTTGDITPTDITSYYDSNGIQIQSENNANSVICTLNNTPTILKEEAIVGDSGIGSYMSCSDSTKHINTWTLIEIESDIIFQKVSSSYNSDGENTITITDRYTINTLGEIQNYSSVIYYLDDDLTLDIAESVVN